MSVINVSKLPLYDRIAQAVGAEMMKGLMGEDAFRVLVMHAVNMGLALKITKEEFMGLAELAYDTGASNTLVLTAKGGSG